MNQKSKHSIPFLVIYEVSCYFVEDLCEKSVLELGLSFLV